MKTHLAPLLMCVSLSASALACNSESSPSVNHQASAGLGAPLLDLGGLSPAQCRAPSQMATTVEEGVANRPCRQMKIVQHHLNALLDHSGFRSHTEEFLGISIKPGKDAPDQHTAVDDMILQGQLKDPDLRRQLFFGTYWSTYDTAPFADWSETERKKAFDQDLRRVFPRMMAVLIASTNPSDVDDGGADWLWELPRVYSEEPDLLARAQMMRDDVNGWIRDSGLHMVYSVGTPDRKGAISYEGDFDFVSIEAMGFLYQFRDRADLLRNDSVWTLLSKDWPEHKPEILEHALWEETNIPISGQDVRSSLQYAYRGLTVFDVKEVLQNFLDAITLSDLININFAETENHVLMTLVHFYLANQWVSNDYRANLIGPQTPVPPPGWTIADWWAPDSDTMVSLIRDIAGRVTHSGMFEDNANAYQQYSYFPLLLLANHAEDDVVRAEAENALHFLSTMYTFQSFEGRRWTPMRRNCENAKRLGMYEADGVGAAIGMLSGAYKWNDSPYGYKHATGSGTQDSSGYELCMQDADCHWKNYSFKKDVSVNDSRAERIPNSAAELSDDVLADFTPQARALYAGFGNYELPRALNAFAIDRHAGFFARMMPKYDEVHYPYSLGTSSVAPHYFLGDTAFDSTVDNERTPAFYFGTNSFMNVSGGMYNPYLGALGWSENNYRLPYNPMGPKCKDNDKNDLKELSGYDNLSKPHTILPQIETLVNADSSFSAYAPIGLRANFKIDEVLKHLPVMRGNMGQPYRSVNIGTYKNVSYGYRVRRDATQWADLAGSPAHELPAEWKESAARTDFTIGNATFAIFDFREYMNNTGREGFYLVVATLKKNSILGWATNVARSFWEVVPGDSFEHLADVENEVKSSNPKSHFPKGILFGNKDFNYTTVVSRETLRLSMKLGAYRRGVIISDEGLMQGIIGVNTAEGTGLELEDAFIEVMKKSHTNKLPLIDVKEVHEDFTFAMTEDDSYRYYACAQDGWVCVNNRHDNSYLWVDSRRTGGAMPYWEHGTFDGSGEEWGCSCGSGEGGNWDPSAPSNGIPEDCSDPERCPEPTDDGGGAEPVCTNPSGIDCSDSASLCPVSESCLPDGERMTCQCEPCSVSSGESCADEKPCVDTTETCVGADERFSVGQCQCPQDRGKSNR